MSADTSDAAVERLAALLCDTFGFPADEGSPLREHSARTLRALAAERAALRQERNQWIANSRENKLIAEANLRERDAARASEARMREALYRLERWGACFIENTPITAETLWREFPAAIKNARATLSGEPAA